MADGRGRLAGRVVVLTGAAGGIGRVWARRLVREGARVALVDIDEAGLEPVAQACRELGGDVVALAADLTKPSDCRSVLDAAAERFGGIDALVNNAALFAQLQQRPFEEISPDELDRVLSANVKGPFLLSQAVAPHLRRRGGGKIVNVSSGSVLAAPRGLAHYVTSKGAIFALTRVLSRELGPDGITVNSLAPGLTVTETSGTPLESGPGTASRSLARHEVAEDLEGTLVYLLSEDSDFLSGQMIVVNGGAQFW